MSNSTLRFAEELQQKITDEISACGDDPGKAALKGKLILLDSELSMGKWELNRALENQNDWAARQASGKIYHLNDQFEKLFRPPGMLDMNIQIGF